MSTILGHVDFGKEILKQVDYMYLDKLNGNQIIIFPPFNVFSLCIKKIDEYETRGINIEPLWPTQILFTVHRTNKDINNEPIVDSKKIESTVKPRLTTCEQDSSIVSRMTFIACQVSGNHTKFRIFKIYYLHYHGIMENRYQEK